MEKLYNLGETAARVSLLWADDTYNGYNFIAAGHGYSSLLHTYPFSSIL